MNDINTKPLLPVTDQAVESQIVDDQASPVLSEGNNEAQSTSETRSQKVKNAAKEVNGPKGLEPTRYGDWESKGRCYDF